MYSLMKKVRGGVGPRVLAVWAVVTAAFLAAVPMAAAEETGKSLGESFDATSVASEVVTKLGPVGVAIVSIMVAVLLFTIGLHFFRRNSKSVAK